MIISTQHLLPAPLPPPPVAVPPPPIASSTFTSTSSFPVSDPAVSEGYGRPVFSVAPQTAGANEAGPPTIGQFAGRTQSKFISLDASDFEASVQESWIGPQKEGRPQGEGAAAGGAPGSGTGDKESRVQVEAPPGVCVCVTRTIFHGLPRAVDAVPGPPPVYPLPGTYPGGFGIDVAFEAGKLPLDVAIFNSARAAGGDEKIRKYLQAVLVVGGTALVPGMAHALESR